MASRISAGGPRALPTTVILKQRGQLDWPQIWSDLAVLAELKGAPELVDELERIARRAEAVIGGFPRRR